MHGHNYVMYVHARPKTTINLYGKPVIEKLDTLGRVIDFSVMKKLVGTWIDDNWDHGFICYKEDVEVKNALLSVLGQKWYMMDNNPTAENMAHYILHDICPHLFHKTDVEIYKVVLWETENCYAEVVL